MKLYLDNAATTPIRSQVLKEMNQYLEKEWQNPSALYGKSASVKDKLESARKQIAKYLGAKPNEIFFTSGGSESNCWAIQGFVRYWEKRGYEPVVVTTAIEHTSILDCVEDLDCEKHIIGVDENGGVNIEELKKLLKDSTKKYLVSVQGINNEIGTEQDISTISKIVHENGGVLHVDAVQMAPHGYLEKHEFQTMNADMMSVSGHKFGAPKGIGILYIKDGVRIIPLIYGTQNYYMRGGTENVAGIMGLAKAFELLQKEEKWGKYNSILETRYNVIKSLMDKGINFHVNCPNAEPSILSITFRHSIVAEALIYMLDIAGIQVSAGSACSAYEGQPSHVLKAIGLSDEDALKTIRMSFAKPLTVEEIDFLTDEIKKSICTLEGCDTENAIQDL